MSKFTVRESPVFPGMPRGGKSVTLPDGREFQILVDGEVVEWVNGQPVECFSFPTVPEAVAFLREYAATAPSHIPERRRP